MPVKIKSKREGFRRCGIPHSETPVVHPDDRFTPEEVKRLQEEPMLIVEIVEPEKEPETTGEKEVD